MTADLFDCLPDGALIANADGIVLAVNAVARQMLGPEARPGARLDDALTLVDSHGLDWCSVNLPYDGIGIRRGVPEQSWLLADGSEVLVTARMVRPSSGAPIERVAVSLRSGRGRARLDRERSDLVATVAHELRSPLTGVKGFVQVLLNRWDVLTDEQKKLMLATTLADAERLARLIAELLDVARLDTGRLGLAVRPIDPDLHVRRVVESVQASASSRTFDIDSDPGVRILADPDKFVQVVTNLVENAVRHGDGTIRVALRDVPAGAQSGDQAWVHLVVSDEGDGIDEALRHRVLTKFWTSGRASGTGLGMYLAHGLAKAHGGDLSIGDRAGGGAEILVRWPAAPTPEDPS